MERHLIVNLETCSTFATETFFDGFDDSIDFPEHTYTRTCVLKNFYHDPLVPSLSLPISPQAVVCEFKIFPRIRLVLKTKQQQKNTFKAITKICKKKKKHILRFYPARIGSTTLIFTIHILSISIPVFPG